MPLGVRKHEVRPDISAALRLAENGESLVVTGRRMSELGSLRVRSLRGAHTHLVEVAGEFDLAGVPAVELEVQRGERSDAWMVVLDLRRVEFIDSSGLRVVVLARRRQPERLSVVKGPSAVQRAFEICGLAELLPSVDEPPTPCGSAQQSAGRARSM